MFVRLRGVFGRSGAAADGVAQEDSRPIFGDDSETQKSDKGNRCFRVALVSFVAFFCLIALKAAVSSAGSLFQFRKSGSGFRPICGSGSGSDSPPFALPNPFYLHYIKFSKDKDTETHDLSFPQYLSVLSAVQHLKPDGILIHGDREPQGEYWHSLMSQKLITFVPREKSMVVGHRTGERLKVAAFVSHAADMAKLDVLLEYGGVVSDFDVIFVRGERMKEYLKKKKAVACADNVDRINMGIIGAHKDSKFLWGWRQSYRDIYSPDYIFNMGAGGRFVATLFSEEIYLMDKACNNPFSTVADLKRFFQDYGKHKWTNSVAIHTYDRRGGVSMKSPKDLEGKLTTYKELLSTIYHNATLPPFDPYFQDEGDLFKED